MSKLQHHTLRDRTLALAGLYQAVYLVNQIAHKGLCDVALFETAIHSLFVANPRDSEQVFGSHHALRKGLTLLIQQLASDSEQRDATLTRYAITLLYLERKVSRNRGLLQRVGEGIERAETQSRHFSATHENVVANLADTYLNTLSTLTPRVMVAGDSGLLQRNDISNKVRALLLAGLRAAVLWRQVGGSRWQLLFRRGALVAEAKRLLNDE